VSATMSHLPTLSHQLLFLQWCHISQRYRISCCFCSDVTTPKVIASAVVSAMMSRFPTVGTSPVVFNSRKTHQD